MPFATAIHTAVLVIIRLRAYMINVYIYIHKHTHLYIYIGKRFRCHDFIICNRQCWCHRHNENILTLDGIKRLGTFYIWLLLHQTLLLLTIILLLLIITAKMKNKTSLRGRASENDRSGTREQSWPFIRTNVTIHYSFIRNMKKNTRDCNNEMLSLRIIYTCHKHRKSNYLECWVCI